MAGMAGWTQGTLRQDIQFVTGMKSLVFFICLVFVLLFGSFQFGFTTLRVYGAIVLMISSFYAVFVKHRKLTLPYRFIGLYILFLSIMLIAQVLNGDIGAEGVAKSYLAYHLVPIVIFVAVDIYVGDMKMLKWVTLLLISVCVVDSVVTYLQYIGNPMGLGIGQFFSTDTSYSVQMLSDFYDTHYTDDLLGRSITFGIMDSVVYNAYLLGAAGMLPLYYAFTNKTKTGEKIFALIAYLAIGAAGFMTQQRAAFFLFLFASAFLILKFGPRWFLLLVGCFVVYYALNANVFEPDNLGRFDDMTNLSGRAYIYQTSLDYIQNHFFLGGVVNCPVVPHNVLFSALISAGIFGGLVMIVLYFKMLYVGGRIVLNRNKAISYSVVYASGFGIYMLIGLTHNENIVNGSVMCWLFFALALKACQLEK